MPKFLDGWKTEIGIVSAAAVMIGLKLGYLTYDTADWLLVAISTWTGLAIKHAIKKTGKSNP